MLGPYFKTRVARRLYALFVGIAIIPVCVLGAYAYFKVTEHLINTQLENVREQTKSVGMEVLARLNTLSDELRLTATLLEHALPTPDAENTSFLQFGLSDTADFGLTPRQSHHLLRASRLLQSEPDGGFMLALHQPNQSQLVWGRLKPGAVWPETVRGIAYCIMDSNGKQLHCSPDIGLLLDDVTLQLDQHSNATSVELKGTPYLIAHWQLPLEPMFAHDAITVVGLYPRSATLVAVAHFQKVFPALLGLILALAIWLAMGQIRRQMSPLEALLNASERIGHGDLETRIPESQPDEFGELAAAFNKMGAGLQRKFRLLEVLSTLDREILSNTPISDVIQTVLDNLPSVTSCENIGILMPSSSGDPCTARLHYRLSTGSLVTRNELIHLDPVATLLLNSNEPHLECPAEGLASEFARPFVFQGLRSLWLFPTRIEGGQASAIILAFEAPPTELHDAQQAGHSMADRLSMATSNLALEDELFRKVHYDALTDLPNLTLLRDRVEQAIHSAERDQRAMALLFLDVDRFRDINDSLGHAAGDVILLEIAHRLQSTIRLVDTVTRFGADEFVVLLTDLEHGKADIAASAIAEHLIKTVAAPIELHGRSIRLGASVGIALYPHNSGRFEDLLKGAEAAMYESKRRSPGSYRFHSGEIERRTRHRFERIQELRQALVNDEFTLYFQPKVQAHSGRIVGAEALIRWTPPDGQVVPPGAFLPLVDEIGLTTQLGNWVIEAACRQLAQWDKAGLPLATVSVNVSPIQFAEGHLLESIEHALKSASLAPERLEVEILEDIALENKGSAHTQLKALNDFGVRIAIDDFGTGFSSLSYLVNIPAHVIKLDRTFLESLTTNKKQSGVLQAIVSLAKSLDLQVVAEGVEEEQQWATLQSMGCDLMQGYLCSPPLPPENFAALLKHNLHGL